MLSAKNIPAGESGQIEAKIKTGNLSGPVEKLITLTTNDPRHPTVVLSIKARVEPEIGISEPAVFFDNVPASREARKEVFLTIPAAKQIKILSAISKDPKFGAALEPVPGSNGKKVKLIVTLKAKAKPGYHFGQIVVKTDSRLNPELAIYVTAMTAAR